MQTAKQEVKDILDRLGEDVSFEEIQYHIYVRQKILKGIDQVDAGQAIPHADVEKRFAKWLGR